MIYHKKAIEKGYSTIIFSKTMTETIIIKTPKNANIPYLGVPYLPAFYVEARPKKEKIL